MRAELGVYAQDKWTVKHLTANIGVRLDYFNLYFPEQTLGPGVLVPTRNITFPENNYAAWSDLSPRLGVVYDLFANGKTALKVNLSRYILAQRLTNNYTDFGNPGNGARISATASTSSASGIPPER